MPCSTPCPRNSTCPCAAARRLHLQTARAPPQPVRSRSALQHQCNASSPSAPLASMCARHTVTRRMRTGRRATAAARHARKCPAVRRRAQRRRARASSAHRSRRRGEMPHCIPTWRACRCSSSPWTARRGVHRDAARLVHERRAAVVRAVADDAVITANDVARAKEEGAALLAAQAHAARSAHERADAHSLHGAARTRQHSTSRPPTRTAPRRAYRHPDSHSACTRRRPQRVRACRRARGSAQ